MGLIEETNELKLDWNKLSDMSRENHVIPVAVQNMDTQEVYQAEKGSAVEHLPQ